MRKKPCTINLGLDSNLFLELQTRTIRAQNLNRARSLLIEADANSIDYVADKAVRTIKLPCYALTDILWVAQKTSFVTCLMWQKC